MGNNFTTTNKNKYSIIEPWNVLPIKEMVEFSPQSFETKLVKVKETNDSKLPCMNRLMVIPNFFTIEECNNLMEKCNNFEDLEDEYPVEYRNATRELIRDKQLADLIFERLKTMIDLDSIGKMITPYGLDSRGDWKACGVNEMMRFSKYETDQYFKIHTDGQFRRSENERSIYTLLIYLNEDFKGGETRFYKDPQKTISEIENFHVLHTLKPRLGQLALFNQDFYHEGCSVTKGTKYILRTEIMYRRIDAHSILRDEAFEQSEAYQKIGQLFKQSDELERKSHIHAASEAYLSGQKLLVESGKTFEYLFNKSFFTPLENIPGMENAQNNLTILPEELILNIFNYLSESEICSLVLPLNRYLNQIARSPIIWKSIYQKYWNGISFQKLSDNDSMIDWYHHARIRNFTENTFKPICIDITSERATFGFFNAETPKHEEPYVGRYSGAHYNFYSYADSVIGRRGIHQGFVFDFLEGEDTNYNGIHRLNVGTFFSKICDSVVRTPSHPLLISIPPHLLKKKNFAELVDLTLASQVPAVCYISRHVMLAYYHNIPNCIVIEKDRDTTISKVSNYQSFAEDIYVVNEYNPIQKELQKSINLLTVANKEIISHVIIVDIVSEDWLTTIPIILPNVTIITASNEEAFKGAQSYAKEVDFRSNCTFWSGQQRDYYDIWY